MARNRAHLFAGGDDAVVVVAAPSAQALAQLADRLRAIAGVEAVRTTVVLSGRSGGRAVAGGAQDAMAG